MAAEVITIPGMENRKILAVELSLSSREEPTQRDAVQLRVALCWVPPARPRLPHRPPPPAATVGNGQEEDTFWGPAVRHFFYSL